MYKERKKKVPSNLDASIDKQEAYSSLQILSDSNNALFLSQKEKMFTFQFSQEFLNKVQNNPNNTVATPQQKPKEAPVKSIADPRYVRETFLKKYLQSFLAWMYKQNPEFSYYLQDDEIVTWFMHNMKHPAWFEEEEKKDVFRLVADCTHYVRQNMSNADTYVISIQPQCRIKEVEA